MLLQFDTDPQCASRSAALAATGATIVVAEPRWPVFFDVVERERPDVIVIACGIIPQHAREAARYLGDGFNTRDIPVILVDVRPEDLAATKVSAPRATIVQRDDLAATVRSTLLAV